MPAVVAAVVAVAVSDWVAVEATSLILEAGLNGGFLESVVGIAPMAAGSP